METTETKRQRRLAARAERQRVAEEGRKKARVRKRLTLGGLSVLALAVVVMLGVWISQTAMTPAPGVSVPNEGADHVNPGAPLTYRNNPPASGPHYAAWTRPGVYSEPQNPGNWVHSLEHGYIVVLYNCDGPCPELQEQLRQFYEAAPKSARFGYQKVVVTPYAELDGRIALVAWTKVLEMDQFDPDQAMAFYKAYVDKGPEAAG